MTVEITTLLGFSAVIVIPGAVAWVALREKVVRLEERVRMHEDGSSKLDKKLDKIFEEIKEIREDIHQRKN